MVHPDPHHRLRELHAYVRQRLLLYAEHHCVAIHQFARNRIRVKSATVLLTGESHSENIDMPTTPIATSPTDASSDAGTGSANENDGRIDWCRLMQLKLMIRDTQLTAIVLVRLALSIIAIVSGDARPILLLFMWKVRESD